MVLTRVGPQNNELYRKCGRAITTTIKKRASMTALVYLESHLKYEWRYSTIPYHFFRIHSVAEWDTCILSQFLTTSTYLAQTFATEY